ncbi:MAG: hypothetical protein HPY87_10095 [Fervidobacterium sp.]|uniref:hypothetical protein n=1 Tax=Fervidobacterium sp. TaxID=1871331 RepID=UPI0025B7CB28|nr:hypothetical protein [Fervidobacterium sp.]NPU90210.1 hypothetical protein [Fervidobacterium sp.]
METKYRVAKIRYAYKDSVNTPSPIPIIFDEIYDTYEEAKDAVDELDNSLYILDNNEYSRPDYYIIPDNVAYYVESGRFGDMSNYDWDNAECECGECNICLAMMIEQDRDYIVANAVE